MNKHQIRSIVYAGLAIVNIVISIFLIKEIGTSGAALGTASSLLLGNGLFMNIIYKTYIGLDVGRFWKTMMPIVFASLIPVLFGKAINALFSNTSWPILAAKGVAFLIIYFASEYFIAMNHEERRLVSSMLHSKNGYGR